MPKPLELDLAKLHGGGSCPSQFYGETHDGLDVYVRYRGGHLSVDIGKERGDDAIGGSRILEADIGPVFDGSISLTQFCKFFGVTINGNIPTESDSDADHYTDFSGQTTYWRAYLERVTKETSYKLFNAVLETFPSGLLVSVETDEKYRLKRLVEVDASSVADHSVWLIDGAESISEIETSTSRYILPKLGQLQLSINFDLWKRPKPYYSSMGLERASKELGRTLIEAGIRGLPEEDEIAYSTFRLTTEFPSSDELWRERLDGLGNRLQQFLPPTKLERVELDTGNVLSDLVRPLDPALVEWCEGGEDRWISILRDHRDGPWLGLRPAKRD